MFPKQESTKYTPTSSGYQRSENEISTEVDGTR